VAYSKTYVLTGGTGFIGRFLLAEMVKRKGGVHVLVRPGSVKKREAVLDGIPGARRRVKALPGDITKKSLGLAPKTRPLGFNPLVERWLAEGDTFEKIAAAEIGRLEQLPRFDVCQEAIAIDRNDASRAATQPDAAAVLGNELFAQRPTKTMEGLTEGISGIRFGAATPEELDELVPPHFVPSGQESKHCQRLTEAKARHWLATLVRS